MLSNDWATWTNKVVGKKCTYSCVRRCGTIQWSSLLSYRQLSLFRYVYWGKGRCVLQNIRASRILSIISCTFLKDHAEVSCANNLLFTVIRRFKFGGSSERFTLPLIPYHVASYGLQLHTASIIHCCRLTIKSTCPMDLHKYPLDTQRCPLMIGSCKFRDALNKPHFSTE